MWWFVSKWIGTRTYWMRVRELPSINHLYLLSNLCSIIYELNKTRQAKSEMETQKEWSETQYDVPQLMREFRSLIMKSIVMIHSTNECQFNKVAIGRFATDVISVLFLLFYSLLSSLSFLLAGAAAAAADDIMLGRSIFFCFYFVNFIGVY